MPDNTRPDAYKTGEGLKEAPKQELPEPKNITPLISSILSRLTVKDESPMHQVGFTLPAKGNEPEKFVTLNELTKELKTKEDLVLVHEIALDENFSLTKLKNNDALYQMIGQTMRNAFWDSMREELEQVPPKKERAINLLMDIKIIFRALLEGNNDKALVYIETYLEESKVREQIENDDRAVGTYTDFVINMMEMACCRARDDEVAALKVKTNLVARLRGIMEVLESMQLDMANYVLSLARGELTKHSIAYEKKKFDELRVVDGDNYPATRDWLMRSYKNSHFIAASSQALTDNVASGVAASATASAVAGASTKISENDMQLLLKYAYIELLDPNVSHPFPELLILDKKRLMELRAQVLRLTVCCAASHVAFGWGLPSDAKERTELASMLLILTKDCTSRAQLKDVLESLWVQAKTVVGEFLQKAGAAPFESQKEALMKAQILELEEESSLVYGVIKKKLILYLEQMILSEEKKAIAIPVVFKDYACEIVKMGRTARKVVQHNRAVYGEYYEEQVNNF